jgi:hypothetical protein
MPFRVGASIPLLSLCPICGGHMRLIAFITEGTQIRKILDHITGQIVCLCGQVRGVAAVSDSAPGQARRNWRRRRAAVFWRRPVDCVLAELAEPALQAAAGAFHRALRDAEYCREQVLQVLPEQFQQHPVCRRRRHTGAAARRHQRSRLARRASCRNSGRAAAAARAV